MKYCSFCIVFINGWSVWFSVDINGFPKMIVQYKLRYCVKRELLKSGKLHFAKLAVAHPFLSFHLLIGVPYWKRNKQFFLMLRR